MDATCNNCDHWDNNSPAVNQENFGECEVLSSNSMQYVLPVVQQAGNKSNGVEMVTSSDFGCNQFASA